jgi:hypothetical protein
MPISTHPTRRTLLINLTLLLAADSTRPIRALAGGAAVRPGANSVPWGVSSSASSFQNHAHWFPKMLAIGIRTVRLFPEWRSIEPTQGKWNWGPTDAMVKKAGEDKIEISAILMGSTPWEKSKMHAFPMKHLADWSNFVSTVVERYKDRIRYWEVWNEGNGGFNDDGHTTADYAKLASVTYTAAKKANPQAQVGLTVASFDAPYIHQAITALAQSGKSGSFDFLCIHPYEIADGLANPNGEIPYLWMSQRLRDALRAAAPEKADAEIWITEIGHHIRARNSEDEAKAAGLLIKLYAMAIAQGIRRTMWFEAQDPAGEEPGFGLLAGNGQPRAPHRAFQTMTGCLGQTPEYHGWLALGANGNGFGFVFQGSQAPVLVGWMPAGETDKSTVVGTSVDVFDAQGARSQLAAGEPLPLTETPVFVVGLPGGMVKRARANAAHAFPWGGNFAAAEIVSRDWNTPAGPQGLFHVGRWPIFTFPDETKGLQIGGDDEATFFVHPSFASFALRDYYIRLTVRRIVPGNVGMNLIYEVADSQGRQPYKNKGEWFSLGQGDGWQSHTWHLTDACFSTMWGYDFAFRPEKSGPFVIGKVEVSTQPLR